MSFQIWYTNQICLTISRFWVQLTIEYSPWITIWILLPNSMERSHRPDCQVFGPAISKTSSFPKISNNNCNSPPPLRYFCQIYSVYFLTHYVWGAFNNCLFLQRSQIFPVP
jgi:hypothetical protein